MYRYSAIYGLIARRTQCNPWVGHPVGEGGKGSAVPRKRRKCIIRLCVTMRCMWGTCVVVDGRLAGGLMLLVDNMRQTLAGHCGAEAGEAKLGMAWRR